MILLVMGSFFLGMIYYCYCDITAGANDENFINNYSLEERSVYQISIIVLYYSVTTLSTVGFGDFVPQNNQDRIFITVSLIFGVGIFSAVLNLFQGLFYQLWNLNNDFDDSDKLSDFFTLLKRFNSDLEINAAVKEEIEVYFKYKWNHDKNNALASDEN
jgi:hypothetical protein